MPMSSSRSADVFGPWNQSPPETGAANGEWPERLSHEPPATGVPGVRIRTAIKQRSGGLEYSNRPARDEWRKRNRTIEMTREDSGRE